MHYFLFLILTLWPSLAQSGDLYAITVGDSKSNIASSTQSDLSQIEHYLKRASNYSQMKLHHIQLFVDQITPETLLNTIGNLNPKQDDVVLFYYSGHGMRSKTKESCWPDLYFGWALPRLGLEEIILRFMQKDQRLLLVIADCCNNVVDTYTTLPFKSLTLANEAEIAAAYKRLFNERHGFVLVSSSAQGEYSWCNKEGGFFTAAFLQSFALEVQKANPSWITLLERTRSFLPVLLQGRQQNPMWEVCLD